MFELPKDIENTLKQARETYGEHRQVCVSAEELCELAAALMKHARYDTHEKAVIEMREKVLDEVADVVIMLHQLEKMFGLTDYEILEHAKAKAERLQRWLDNSDSLEQSIKDREVVYPPNCTICDWQGETEMCRDCVNYSNFHYKQF
jgi:NTP pyrophosphatase (non-canonical NTP hydrolase)